MVTERLLRCLKNNFTVFFEITNSGKVFYSFHFSGIFPMAQAWNDINDPGVYKSPAEKSGKARPVDYEGEQPVKNEKQEPEVKLVSAQWAPGEAGLEFNKKCTLNIKAEFLKETFRKKITCSLFVLYNGNEEDVKHKVDAYLDNDGNAKADITLYYGNEYYDAAQKNPEATCQYKAKIEHPTATAVLESDLLDMPQCMTVDFVEIADIHFHHNCALPCLDEKGELIGLLGSAFSFAKDNPDRELIVHGHADTSGDPEYNLAISKRRAEAIKGLLDNDMDLWNGVVTCKDHKLETEDYQQTLKGLSGKYGWDCDPGDVDNKDGPKTKEGVKGFQTEYNSRYNGTLTVDGVVGPKTWEAIGKTIRSILEDYLKNDQRLDPIPTITYGYPDGNGIYPCGEGCPIENAGDSNYKSAENRRVELVFYKKDDPTPAIVPAAGRKIGIEKDPVSEKKWKKTQITATLPPVVKKSLKAEIIEITFLNPYKSCLKQVEIAPPHWKKDRESKDADGSLYAAVYKTQTEVEMDVSIDISETAPAETSLSIEAVFGMMKIFGVCKNEVGRQTVKVKIDKSPTTVSRLAEDVRWVAKTNDGGECELGSTYLELFVILGNPTDIYSAQGVWVEALRALCNDNAICACSKKRDAAATVTAFCHTIGYRYDTFHGRPSYGGTLYGTDTFKLSEYLQNASSVNRVNCYDQAAAVQTLCGALGVTLGWVAMKPYGQINSTYLVGVPGECNNPFFEDKGTPQLIDPADARRTGFGNHAFADFDTEKNVEEPLASNSKKKEKALYIIDACAGPHTGTESFDAYIKVAIDTRYVSGGTVGKFNEGITKIA